MCGSAVERSLWNEVLLALQKNSSYWNKFSCLLALRKSVLHLYQIKNIWTSPPLNFPYLNISVSENHNVLWIYYCSCHNCLLEAAFQSVWFASSSNTQYPSTVGDYVVNSPLFELTPCKFATLLVPSGARDHQILVHSGYTICMYRT